MKTSLKAGFAQIFSCYPKKRVAQNLGGGAAAPLAPPARTPIEMRLLSKFGYPITDGIVFVLHVG